MKEKLKIARNFRISRKKFSRNVEHRKIFFKCYWAYVIQCIFQGNDVFRITFNGKYIESFPIRIMRWFNYFLDKIYRFYLIHFTPKDDKTAKKYELIHFGVSVPIDVKVTDAPDEYVLHTYLNSLGFKVVQEYLYSVSTVYDIAKI